MYPPLPLTTHLKVDGLRELEAEEVVGEVAPFTFIPLLSQRTK